MKFLSTSLNGVIVVETDVVSDYRGSFSRIFCERELVRIIGEKKIAQINYSITTVPGTVRGIHYQNSPHAETKLIRCTKGQVWDIAVDMRAGSPTFLQWHAEELSSENTRMLIIPEGCAHGFQSLVADSELLYLHTDFYTPESERGVSYNDPQLSIPWPLPIKNLSKRDQSFPSIPHGFSGINL